LSSSSHWALILSSKLTNPVVFAARLREARDEAQADRVGDRYEYDRERAGLLLHCSREWAVGYNDVRRQADQLGCIGARAIRLVSSPVKLDMHVAAFAPSNLGFPR
jgi:hypothetical protein